MAARTGGGDESANPRLRQAILAARAENMPMDNIRRAIQRGTGELPGVSYEEATFEGYGPGGVAIILDVLTDNRKRTVAEIRHLMDRYGGHLGEQGCVSWMFDKKGLIVVDKAGVTAERLLECVMDAGGDDYSEEEDAFEVACEESRLLAVRDVLATAGLTVKSAEVSRIPKNTLYIAGEDASSVLKLMEVLEEHDDIQKLSSNFDMDDSALVGAS